MMLTVIAVVEKSMQLQNFITLIIIKKLSKLTKLSLAGQKELHMHSARAEIALSLQPNFLNSCQGAIAARVADKLSLFRRQMLPLVHTILRSGTSSSGHIPVTFTIFFHSLEY